MTAEVYPSAACHSHTSDTPALQRARLTMTGALRPLHSLSFAALFLRLIGLHCDLLDLLRPGLLRRGLAA
jgi:hypothetical protein